MQHLRRNCRKNGTGGLERAKGGRKRGGRTDLVNEPLVASSPATLSRCRRCGGGSGWRGGGKRQKESKPRPGPDNGELSGLRRGVGDISQIRTDHKPLDAIQFCGAAIRRLIMCHPSIRPPPAAVSPAINPLMTSCALRQSPFSLLPPSSHFSVVCCRGKVEKGIKQVRK